jgi:hypothetical protein
MIDHALQRAAAPERLSLLESRQNFVRLWTYRCAPACRTPAVAPGHIRKKARFACSFSVSERKLAARSRTR